MTHTHTHTGLSLLHWLAGWLVCLTSYFLIPRWLSTGKPQTLSKLINFLSSIYHRIDIHTTHTPQPFLSLTISCQAQETIILADDQHTLITLLVLKVWSSS